MLWRSGGGVRPGLRRAFANSVNLIGQTVSIEDDGAAFNI